MTKWKNLILAAILSFAFYGHAVTSDDRYGTIVERNVFRLTSPPPPAPPPTNNEALDRNIELSGISTVNGRKKAFFVVKAKNAKEGPQYVSLGENERKEFLEVVSISEPKGEVQVINSGNSMILSFTNNGVKVAPGSVPATTAMATSSTGIIPNHLNTAPGATPYNPAQPNVYGGRSVTVTGGNPSAMSGQTGDNGLRSIPSRSVRLSPIANTGQPQPSSEPAVDPVTQRALMEIQAEHAKQTGQKLPPLPPLPQ